VNGANRGGDMARPQKEGLDYFPLDVSFDDNVELIEAELGLQGFAILIKLWQKIYTNGYYLEWNNDVALLFSKKINSEINEVSSVVNACLRRDIFNKLTYEKHNILTSAGIQKRYITACSSSKRKSITMEEKYLLVEDKYKKLITELIKFTPEEIELTPEESTQKKVKEKKVKESIKNIIPEIENFRQRYDKKILASIDQYFEILRTTRVSGKISESVMLQVYAEMNKHPPVVVEYACKTVVTNPKLHDKKENYFYGIMRNTKAEEAEEKLNIKNKSSPKGAVILE
jgi:hypothetical protein